MSDPAPVPEPQIPEATHVIVRPYPKIVYLYLTWIASLVCGVIHPEAQLVDAGGALRYSADAAHTAMTIGRVWMALFVFNILVIAFEFSRIRSVALVFFVVALVFAAFQFGFAGAIAHFFGGLELVMNKIFYYSMAAVFSVIYLLVFIVTRFNYWEIQPNEILHHHGFLGDVHRYPTRGLRMKKEITDVMEFLLLRSGTLVLDPSGEQRPIVLENVIGLNRVEEKIQRLLGTLKVRVDAGRIGGID